LKGKKKEGKGKNGGKEKGIGDQCRSKSGAN